MKISVPVVNKQEVQKYSSIKEVEYYGGYVPYSYYEEFSLMNPLNSRDAFQNDNFRDLSELIEAIECAGRADKQFCITFNEKMYGPRQIEYILGILSSVRKSTDYSFKIIVGNLALIEAVRSSLPSIKIVLSTEAPVYSPEMVGFFVDMGVDSFAIPRDTSFRDMQAIRDRFPSIELKAFAMNEGCFFSDGHCHTYHMTRTPYFCQSIRLQLRHRESRKVCDGCVHDKSVKTRLFLSAEYGSAAVTKCSLCSIPRLIECGIDSLKLVGRYPTKEKDQWIGVLAAAIRRANAIPASEFHSWVRSELVSPDSQQECDSGQLCYYDFR